MLTAMVCIENSPMVVSADDCGVIKIWDIRGFKCCQTIQLSFKTVITRMLDIGMEAQICFVGSRVSFMNFDMSIQDKKEELYPISVEFNGHKNELVYSTRKELRFIDLISGTHKTVF